MTLDFSSETMQARKSGTLFLSAERKESLTANSVSNDNENILKNEEEMTFSDEEKWKELVTSRPILKKMANRSYLKSKKMMKRRNLEHQEGRNN